MKKLCFTASVLIAFAMQAAEWTWDTDQTGLIELSEDTTITVPAGKTVTCSGIISGAGKLIKSGGGLLILSGDNTYTGGTQVDGGKLQANHRNAFGSRTNAIRINSDCNGSASAADANVVALVVNVTDFDYDISCAAWTTSDRPKNDGNELKSLYNLAVIVASATLSGKVTGGDLSLRQMGTEWGTSPTKISGLTMSGEIDCDTVYFSNRAQGGTFSGKVKANRLLLPSKSGPTKLTLSNADNSIGLIDVGYYGGGGGLFPTAENALGGAKLISTANSTTSNHSPSYVDMKGVSQTIDVPLTGVHTAPPSVQYYYINGTDAATLTICGTEDATSDWPFTGAMTLVWNPVGAYTLLNTLRVHELSGALCVSNGTFAIADGCSFANIAALKVAANATFEIAAGTCVKNDGSLPVEIETSSRLAIPEDVTWSVLSLKRGNSYVKAGRYAAATLPQIAGLGTLVVSTTPGVVETTSTWSGESDGALSVDSNWKEGTVDLTSGGATLVFAESGSSAVVDADGVVVKGVRFETVPTFELKGSKSIQIGEGGIKVAGGGDSKSYALTAPVILGLEQALELGENTELTVRGPILCADAGAFDWTVFGAGAGVFVGNAGSDWTGDFRIETRPTAEGSSQYVSPRIIASGVDPFGPAAQNGTGTLRLVGRGSGTSGDDARLYLSNAIINKAVSCEGRYRGYITSLSGTTNTITGSVTYPATLTVESASKITFGGAFDVLAEAAQASSYQIQGAGEQNSCVVFDGCVSYPGQIKVSGGFGDVFFNALSNAVGEIYLSGTARVLFGSDYALSDGRTKLSQNTSSGVATFDFRGCDQHIGSLGQNRTYTTLTTSAGPMTLRVNQTEDIVFNGKIAEGVSLVKEGSATLTLSESSAVSVTGNVTVAEGTLSLATAGVLPQEVTIVIDVDGNAVLSLPEGNMKVNKLFYRKGGVVRPAPKGTYGASCAPDFEDAELIKAHLNGSGTMTVRKSDIRVGLLLMVY